MSVPLRHRVRGMFQQLSAVYGVTRSDLVTEKVTTLYLNPGEPLVSPDIELINYQTRAYLFDKRRLISGRGVCH